MFADYLFFLGFIAAIIFAFFSSSVASSKGFSAVQWFIGGLLFGPVALIAAAGLPDLKQRRLIGRFLDACGGWQGRGIPEED